MVSEAVVVDISSDEEECRWGFQIPSPSGSVGSDDVIVVDEIPAIRSSKRKRNSDFWEPKKRTPQDQSDGDCVVLDGDPESDCVVGEEKASLDGSEDILIVKEKGQLACRDFPHSRHLCLNFPFSATPHEKHCSMCHCYVCDSLAPCIYWGNGASSTDHCHSTDKDASWKAMRKSFKQTGTATADIQKLPEATTASILSSCNSASPRHRVPIIIPSPTTRSGPFVPCSTTSFKNRHPTVKNNNVRLFTCGRRSRHQLTRTQQVITGAIPKTRTPSPGAQASQPSVHGSLVARQDHLKYKSIGSARFTPSRTNAIASEHRISSHQNTQKAANQKQPSAMIEAMTEMESFQGILAMVASELGVSESLNSNSSIHQHVASFPTSASDQFFPATDASQNVGFSGHPSQAPTHVNPVNSEPGGSGNIVTQSVSTYGFTEGPLTTVTQPIDQLFEEMAQNEILLDSFEQETMENAAKEPVLSGSLADMLFYDLESPWSDLARI